MPGGVSNTGQGKPSTENSFYRQLKAKLAVQRFRSAQVGFVPLCLGQ